MINLWNFYEKKAIEKRYLNVLKSQIFENLYFESLLIPSNTYSQEYFLWYELSQVLHPSPTPS